MGKKHGPGSIRWVNGDTFEGSFVNDLREGTVSRSTPERFDGSRSFFMTHRPWRDEVCRWQ